MKHVFTSLLLMLTLVSAFAQEKSETLNRDYLDAKISEITRELRLTDQQKADFTPVYTSYSNEMRTAIGEPPKAVKGEKPQTSEEAAARVKERLANQQKALAIRLNYVDAFAKVLDADQLTRLYEVEGGIQQRMMKRKGEHKPGRGQGHDRGPGHGRAPGDMPERGPVQER